MKLKIEVDAEPEELRRFLGLPDIANLQNEMINAIRENMLAGVEGFDPLSLMKPYLPENLQSLQTMQQKFWQSITETQTAKPSKVKE